MNSIELKSVLYKYINKSGVKDLINGKVYLENRPLNSDKNDIVIKSLAVVNNPLHSSVVLVQVYVKDIFRNETYFPNYTLLNEVTKYLLPLLKNKYLEDEQVYFDVEHQRDYKVENAQEYVSVMVLQTRTIKD